MQLVGLLLFIIVTTFLMGAFGREIVSAPVAAVLQPPLTYKAVPAAGPQPDAMSLSGAAAASSRNYTGLFQEFVTKYRRSYAGAERDLRFRIFKENVDTIERLSKNAHEGMYAINNMADISPAEYKKRFVTTRKRTAPKVPSLLQTQGPNDREPQMIPDEFDWTAVVDEKTKVATNYMQPVQNQGDCASCWAFAAAAALEAQFRIQFRKEVKLSEAAFIACTGKGCNEGRAEDVFNGFGGGKGRFKMVRDEALSYENLVQELHKPTKNVLNSQGRPVREELVNPKRLQEACSTAQNDALQHLPEVNIEHTAIQHDESMLESTEEAFKRSLISNGPLVVFLHYPEDSQFAGPNYLAQEKMCTVKGVVQEADHIVVIVGYGTREITVGKKKISVNVWKIRNSHGDDVGDKGYFYVERGKNTCHVLSDGVSVTLRSPQKPVVQGNQKRKKMVEQSKSERAEYDAEAPKTEVKKQRQNPKKL